MLIQIYDWLLEIVNHSLSFSMSSQVKLRKWYINYFCFSYFNAAFSIVSGRI